MMSLTCQTNSGTELTRAQLGGGRAPPPAFYTLHVTLTDATDVFDIYSTQLTGLSYVIDLAPKTELLSLTFLQPNLLTELTSLTSPLRRSFRHSSWQHGSSFFL